MDEKHKFRIEAGAFIFQEGEEGHCAYLIKSGRVEVSVGDGPAKVVLTQLGPGEIFGETSVLDGAPRPATVVALEPCEMIVVPREALAERFEDADPILRLIMSVILRRMRLLNLSRGGKIQAIHDQQNGFNPIEGEELAQHRSEVVEKLHLEADLKQALVDGHFQLHYQPVIRMEDRQVVGFEALIRWDDPERGQMRPDVFMGLAEETSLVVPIGEWVIDQACQDLAKFNEAAVRNLLIPPFVSINIAGRQFQSPNLFAHLSATARKYAMDPAHLKLEVTEKVLLAGSDVVAGIEYARQLGFPVALDDFGTGYSSINCLSQFPVDTLKIDISFVRRVPIDPRTTVVTKAVVDMAVGLGTAVVAEGIEREEEMKAMKELGCNFAQGFLFCQPVPFEMALEYLLDHGIRADKAS